MRCASTTQLYQCCRNPTRYSQATVYRYPAVGYVYSTQIYNDSRESTAVRVYLKLHCASFTNTLNSVSQCKIDSTTAVCAFVPRVCPAGGLHSLEAAHRSGVSYSGASRIDWEVVWAAQCKARPPVPSAAPLEPSLLALSDVGGPCIRDASVEALPSERSLDGKGYRVYIQHNRPLPLRHDARTSCERSRRGQKRGGTLGIPISTTKAVFFSAKVCHL